MDLAQSRPSAGWPKVDRQKCAHENCTRYSSHGHTSHGSLCAFRAQLGGDFDMFHRKIESPRGLARSCKPVSWHASADLGLMWKRLQIKDQCGSEIELTRNVELNRDQLIT